MGTKNVTGAIPEYTLKSFNQWDKKKNEDFVLIRETKKKYRLIIKKLCDFMLFLSEHKLTFNQILNKDVFSSSPFEKAHS